MRQITVRQARRELSEAKIKEWMPFQLVSDGIVIAVVVPQYDVAHPSLPVRQANKAKQGTKHDVALANELKFSKAGQVRGKMGW